MKIIQHKFIIHALMGILFVAILACSSNNTNEKEDDDIDDIVSSLTTNTTTIAFDKEESSFDLTITTNVDTWVISSSGTSWISLSETSGTSGTTTVTITAAENTSTERTTAITVNANGVDPVKINVTQEDGTSTFEGLYPDYNTDPITPDNTGMTSTAAQLADQITLGWNIGNALEATGGETAWGNPTTSKALIDLVKQNGFNAIRIPCSWDQYMENSATAELKLSWLNRVKQVIEYCTDNDMYVLLNIHWDGGWLENNVTEDKQEENNAKQKAFWQQIATHLRDFDEHLLFAGTNEPNVEDATQMAVLNSYHQTFIDAVRATGGKNAYRTLVIQGPSTDIEKTNTLMTTLPTDTATDRMMVEVHYYTPYQFCLMTEDDTWGNMFYYWGATFHSTTDTTRNATWGEESTVNANFELMKTQFVDQGIPVVLGEYSAQRRTSLSGDDLDLHLASRAYYLKYVTQQAKANGLIPFYWDEGGLGNHAHGIFDRTDNTVFDQQALDGLLDGLE